MSKFIESTRDFINEWTINILILLFGMTTLVQAFIVPTPSMDSTVRIGDHLLVDKLLLFAGGFHSASIFSAAHPRPKRGDVIVFRYPIRISTRIT